MTSPQQPTPNGTYWDDLQHRYIEPGDADWSPDGYAEVTGETLTTLEAVDLILGAEP